MLSVLHFAELGEGQLTVGKIYAGLIILENWRAYKAALGAQQVRTRKNRGKNLCTDNFRNSRRQLFFHSISALSELLNVFNTLKLYMKKSLLKARLSC